jgi:hypothetical protein
MELKPKAIRLGLLGLTCLNVYLAAAVPKLNACNCYANGLFVCSGASCSGTGSWCLCDGPPPPP